MKRTVYESPVAAVISLDHEDILTASGGENLNACDLPIEIGKLTF